ncbi:carbonic anhydrase [Prosthecomicrobium sp. N25]|uniref:carbonic anhydrase n=1 Tax=Prosthecomicrobium sp. N25 TaxID=3129254 RepID=UPI0030768D93
MAGVGLAAVAAGVGLSLGPAAAADGAGTSLTPDQALTRLQDGNARFVANAQLCAADLNAQRGAVAKGQAPWATIVSCADSRVPPELVFGGLGLGELFITRNAGNLVDTAVLGTIEYGAAVLGSPLIVVLGHSKCGAVAAACDVVVKNATFPGSIGPMIEPIVPAALAVRDKGGDFVDAAVRESAIRTAARLPARSSVVADLVAKGKVKIVSARYDLDSGKVEFLG